MCVILSRVCTQLPHCNSLVAWFTSTEKEKRNVYYVMQWNLLRTTIPKLCGMCPLTASDWNLHSLNNCSTQSVVVYCHSESKSSADRNTGKTREGEERELSSVVLSETQSECSVKAYRCKDNINCFLFTHTLIHAHTNMKQHILAKCLSNIKKKHALHLGFKNIAITSCSLFGIIHIVSGICPRRQVWFYLDFRFLSFRFLLEPKYSGGV